MLTVKFTERRAWRRCATDGNIFQRLGVYELQGVKYIAWQCQRCSTVILTDQKVEEFDAEH